MNKIFVDVCIGRRALFPSFIIKRRRKYKYINTVACPMNAQNNIYWVRFDELHSGTDQRQEKTIKQNNNDKVAHSRTFTAPQLQVAQPNDNLTNSASPSTKSDINRITTLHKLDMCLAKILSLAMHRN